MQGQKKYLVTGGCGFIGSHLVAELENNGHHVIVLDNLSTGKRENIKESVELVVGDVRDARLVNELMKKVDGCFHLAAIASVELSNQDWVGTHEVNLTGAINIFNAAKYGSTALPVPVVYASSAAIYGHGDQFPLTETVLPKPLTAYGADKLGCEYHAQAAWHVHQVPTVGLRLFNVYGPRQNPESIYSGVISIFLDRLRKGELLTVYGDGDQRRDFVYVKDVVQFFMRAMQDLRSNNRVYNVCTGESISIMELALLLGTILNQAVTPKFAPQRVGDIKVSVGSPWLARQELDIAARYSIEQGLTEFVRGHVAVVG